jgi:protein O-mannosyl-transferase
MSVKNTDKTAVKLWKRLLFSKYTGLVIILIVSLLQYWQVKDFDFLNYDDGMYVVDNKDLRDFSPKGIKKILLDPQYRGEVIPPLTIVSLAANYAVGGMSPGGYHITNLIFHLANIVLVFFLIYLLFNNLKPALFVAAVFAFHPSGTEAIAWVSARKEVQYTFFYLLALFSVLRFWRTGNRLFYLLAFGLFITSYYSKFAAATFPVFYIALALLWKQRKDYLRVALESIPFLAIPVYSLLLSGYIYGGEAEVYEELHNISEGLFYDAFTFMEKLVLGGYSFVVYLGKFIWPFEQQIIYPYPDIHKMGGFPGIYYVFSVITLLILSGIGYFLWKGRLRFSTPMGFGILFFLVHVVILLHVLPIGGRVVVADRYTYLPFIGLAILFYYTVEYTLKKSAGTGIVLAGFIVLLNVQLIRWIPEWKDSGSIFTHLVEKEPDFAGARVNQAKYLTDHNRMTEAEYHLLKAIELEPSNVTAYSNLGTVYLKLEKPKTALKYLRTGLEYNSNNPLLFYITGQAFQQMKDYDTALKMFDKALELDADAMFSHMTFYSMGSVHEQKNDMGMALRMFEQSIETDPYFAPAYSALGMVYAYGMYSFEQGVPYLEKACQLAPGDPRNLWNLAKVYLSMNESRKLLETAKALLHLNPDDGMGFYYRGMAQIGMRNQAIGCRDLQIAQKQGINEAVQAFNRHCL